MAMVDFTGMFLHFEPGYAGRLPDRSAYQLSSLGEKLQNVNGVQLPLICSYL